MKKDSSTYIAIYGIKFTIKEKNGRFHVAFSYKGKRINRTTGLKVSRENLTLVKNKLLVEIAEGLTSQKVDTAIDDIFENFAEIHFELAKENLRDHVYERNRSNYRKHILPYFKGRKLSSIKPIELEQWQNKLLKKYKASSIQKYRSILFSILERAYQNEFINKNPLRLVSTSKMNVFGSCEVINPFTQKELDTLVKNINGTYMQNFIKFMSNTGMRPGEIIALKWSDINFEEKFINVNKTIINGKEGLPKTNSSIRVIDMIQGAYEALIEQNKLTSKYEYVFVNSSNERFYSHDAININLKKILIAHKIDIRPLYQLRHSFASRMIKNGIDITWVSNMLGHKDSSITLNTYTKFIKEDKQTRMNNIEKINGLLHLEK